MVCALNSSSAPRKYDVGYSAFIPAYKTGTTRTGTTKLR